MLRLDWLDLRQPNCVTLWQQLFKTCWGGTLDYVYNTSSNAAVWVHAGEGTFVSVFLVGTVVAPKSKFTYHLSRKFEMLRVQNSHSSSFHLETHPYKTELYRNKSRFAFVGRNRHPYEQKLTRKNEMVFVRMRPISQSFTKTISFL